MSLKSIRESREAKIIKESGISLITNKKYTFSIWLVIVCIITIITKLGLFIYTNNIYKKNKRSINYKRRYQKYKKR